MSPFVYEKLKQYNDCRVSAKMRVLNSSYAFILSVLNLATRLTLVSLRGSCTFNHVSITSEHVGLF